MNPLPKLLTFVSAGIALPFLPPEAAWSAALLLFIFAFGVLRPPQRRALALLHLTILLIGGAIYSLALAGNPSVQIGPAQFSLPGLLAGISATTPLVAFLSLCALLSRFLPARQLLPYIARRPFPLYLAGSLARFVPTLRLDAQRIREAQSARGQVFRPGLRGLPTWIPLLVPLIVSTVRRTRDQALALRLSGISPRGRPLDARAGFHWALVPALAALAVVGRLTLLSVPNVSFSFFIVFIAGAAYGPRVGALVGLLSRLAGDLLLSGLHPIFLAMVPVEAFLGFFSGLLGLTFNFGQRAREPYLHAAILAGTTGWLFTALFSVAADTATWILFRLLAPGLPGAASEALWTGLVLSGLLFNVPSMVFNAVVFALATYPVLRALRAGDLVPPRARLLPVN